MQDEWGYDVLEKLREQGSRIKDIDAYRRSFENPYSHLTDAMVMFDRRETVIEGRLMEHDSVLEEHSKMINEITTLVNNLIQAVVEQQKKEVEKKDG